MQMGLVFYILMSLVSNSYVSSYLEHLFLDHSQKNPSYTQEYAEVIESVYSQINQNPSYTQGYLEVDLSYTLDPPFPTLSLSPIICGGMFVAYPTARTIAIFKKLEKEVVGGGNDQWSMIELLKERDTVIINGFVYLI